MSTKKKPAQKPITVKKPAASQAAQPATPKVVKPKEDKKERFLADSFAVTAWVPDKETRVLRRVVDKVNVWSEEDLANRPADRDVVSDNAKEKAVKEGWFLSDVEALQDARMFVRQLIAKYAVEVEYSKDCICRHCTAEFLRTIEASLRKIDMYEVLSDVRCSFRPPVMPDEKEWDEYEIVDGKFQKKKPNVEIRGFKLGGEQAKQMASLLSSITGEKIGENGEVVELKQLKK